MFNTKTWSKITEKTYGYKSRNFCKDNYKIYYSHVINDIGEYFIVPSFGDFLSIDESNIDHLDIFFNENINKPIKVKICSTFKPEIENIDVKESGYIHQIEFDSYDQWRNNIIKFKFRNKIKQSEKNAIQVKYLNDKESLYDFYKMHALLRINKFNEIPQPWSFFECIYDDYFKQNKGSLINAYDPNGKLIAGILLIIEGEIAYYKFNASYLEALKYRPNNYLMDRLIYQCDQIGVKKLNLGFTGASNSYDGLRKYKLHAGAKEYPRYILQNRAFSNLNNKLIIKINQMISKLLTDSISLEEVDNFSRKYYKYFI